MKIMYFHDFHGINVILLKTRKFYKTKSDVTSGTGGIRPCPGLSLFQHLLSVPVTKLTTLLSCPHGFVTQQLKPEHSTAGITGITKELQVSDVMQPKQRQMEY